VKDVSIHRQGFIQGFLGGGIDTIDYVTGIGNVAACAAHPSCAAHSFCIGK
jgi:hypothetical protein